MFLKYFRNIFLNAFIIAQKFTSILPFSKKSLFSIFQFLNHKHVVVSYITFFYINYFHNQNTEEKVT